MDRSERFEHAEAVRRGVAGDGTYHDTAEHHPRSVHDAAQQLGLPESEIERVVLVAEGELVVHKSGRGTVIPVGGGGMYEVEDASALKGQASSPAKEAPEGLEAAAEERAKASEERAAAAESPKDVDKPADKASTAAPKSGGRSGS
jgi:hypothetical protein